MQIQEKEHYTDKLQVEKADRAFSKAKEEAYEWWTGALIEKFEGSRNPKEKWSAYKKLTKKEQRNSVLPLIHDSEPVFDTTDKCKLLQEVFLIVTPNMWTTSLTKTFTTALVEATGT